MLGEVASFMNRPAVGSWSLFSACRLGKRDCANCCAKTAPRHPWLTPWSPCPPVARCRALNCISATHAELAVFACLEMELRPSEHVAPLGKIKER